MMGTRPTFLARCPGLAQRIAGLMMLSAMGIGAPAFAQSGTDTSDTEARAAIVTAGSLVMAQTLDFGDIIPGQSAGTVRVRIDGTRTATGPVILVGGRHHPAVFAGRGRRNQQIELSIGTPTIQITGPGAPMTVTLFEIGDLVGGLRGNRPGRFRITTRDGMFTFPVGATLSVGANQQAGVYTGSFTVLHEYQ